MCPLGLPQNLAFVGSLSIQYSRVAVHAGVIEVVSGNLNPVVGIVTFDMLPCVAKVAVYRIPVIVSEVAYTFNRVWLFLCRRRSLIGHIVGYGRCGLGTVDDRLTRSR